jgi:hypothetical protein
MSFLDAVMDDNQVVESAPLRSFAQSFHGTAIRWKQQVNDSTSKGFRR